MERTKEEELNLVLKNYDKVKAERDRFQKENEDLKKKLAQQEILYKNMLATYSERKEVLPKKKSNGEKIRLKFTTLNEKYKKLQAAYQQSQEYIDEKAIKMKNLADENVKMKNMLDSLRGALCSAHNKADSFCFQLNVSNRGEECLNQEVEEKPKEVVAAPVQARITLKEFQQQQFIKYIRDIATIYRNTGTLNGISTLAQKYGVATITKVKFFQYRLDEEPLSDEEILEVYERLKKKIL